MDSRLYSENSSTKVSFVPLSKVSFHFTVMESACLCFFKKLGSRLDTARYGGKLLLSPDDGKLGTNVVKGFSGVIKQACGRARG